MNDQNPRIRSNLFNERVIDTFQRYLIFVVWLPPRAHALNALTMFLTSSIHAG